MSLCTIYLDTSTKSFMYELFSIIPWAIVMATIPYNISKIDFNRIQLILVSHCSCSFQHVCFNINQLQYFLSYFLYQDFGNLKVIITN